MSAVNATEPLAPDRQTSAAHASRTGGARAALSVSGMFTPTVAAVATVVAYIVWRQDVWVLLAGIGAALATWPVMATLVVHLTTIEGANAGSHQQLLARLTSLEAELADFDGGALRETKDADAVRVVDEALGEARRHRDHLAAELSGRPAAARGKSREPVDPLRWIRGVGYLSLWESLHRAEEASLLIAPLPVVVARARRDELRLKGSSIENRDDLAASLKQAIESLSAGWGLSAGASAPSPTARALRPADEMLARETIRQDRSAINEFRDNRWYGIVRAIDQLYNTLLLASAVTLMLVGVAVLEEVQASAVLAGATFYVVGAAAALLQRLYQQSTSDMTVDDYGLSRARLVATPTFAGLAALGGVIFVPMLSALASAGTQAAESVKFPELGAIFDLTRNPQGLLLAAMFGLSPAVLIGRLQQTAEQYKKDLKSSEAAGSAAAADHA